MKTKFILPLLLIVGAFLAGCATSNQLNQLQIGMTKDQVIAIMGQPDSTSAQANVEYLTYYLEVTSAEAPIRDSDRAYMVRLVNGKVESFGRFAQLFDLYNRPVTSARPGDANFPSSALVANPTLGGTDIASQLEKLEALKAQGVLTDAEFQQAKAKVLAQP